VNILITVSVRWWNANAYYAISLAEALLKLGHKVYVAGDPAYPPTVRAQAAGLETLEIKFASFNPLILLKELYRLYKFVKENEIKMINAHRSEDHLLTALVAKRLKIPLVRTLGDVRSPKNNFINRWLHMQATRYHILSSDSIWVRYVSTWPEFKPNMSIIPGGVDGNVYYRVQKKQELQKKLNITSDTFIVGIVARLDPIKDHVNFITAASLVLEKIPDIIFIISGSEENVHVKDLTNLASSLRIVDHFRFMDRHDPVRDVISLLDVGVIASKGSEVIARIAMEYIAIGIPVVATDINVLPEVVQDKRNGFIVPPEDPYEMASAIIKLLEDNELRKQISENNLHDFRNKFDIFLVANSIGDLYERLLNNKEPDALNAKAISSIDKD
jgi:glycosyltransferase involved in cell wall biosynthesis